MRLRFALAVLLFLAALTPHAVSARSGQDPLVDAQGAYNTGHYRAAVDLLTGAVAKSPNDAPLYFLLGQCYYQLRDFDRATISLERSVQLSPGQSEYHDWLGKAYGRRAEKSIFLSAIVWAKKTRKEFALAVRLNPSNLEAQRDLIRYDMFAPGIAGGGDEQALQQIEALQKIDPVQGQLARGEFLNAKKRPSEADTVFAKILESHTDRIGVYFEVADYFIGRRNAAKVREAIDDAERIDPADRRLKFYHGILLAMDGKDLPQAETLLKTYLATVPDSSDLPAHSDALEWLGKIYEFQGRFSEAAEQYRASSALDPQNKAAAEGLKRVETK